MIVAIILFWISVAALVHTYLLYPALIDLLARRRVAGRNTYESARDLPGVSVLMAVHNEENVISEKIESIILNKHPEEKLEILVGSDASTDNTDKILQNLASSYKYLRFFRFDERRGKSGIINDLVRLSKEDILIITDANVILEQDTIYHLLKHFKDTSIGLVDSNMKHKGIRDSGISVQENLYITREVKIKERESILWGTMMGPFGGCYALRRELYCDVPSSFLVDDFFINMKVIASAHKAIIETDAIVYEDVSSSLSEEFRRKARIAAGNFQNLKYFSSFLLSSARGVSLSFISHKVLRWIGPFFFATIFFTSLFLGREYFFYRYLFYFQVFILILPLVDYLLGKIKIHVIILRFVTHFISMNFALLVGFINYLKGVKSNVWQPTRRNQ